MSLVIPNVSGTFPVGTNVGLYTGIREDSGTPTPFGGPIAQAVVQGDGSLTFEAVALDGTTYVAAALIGGVWHIRRASTTAPPSVGVSSVNGRVGDVIDLEEAAAILAAGKGFVEHGANAEVPRPAGFASVEWLGSVEPENAIDGDTWVSTE